MPDNCRRYTYHVLSATKKNASTISNHIIISQFNYFTFISALLPSVLRLNLALPFQLQRLGTRQVVSTYLDGFFTIFYQLTKALQNFFPEIDPNHVSVSELSVLHSKILLYSAVWNALFLRQGSRNFVRDRVLCHQGRQKSPARMASIIVLPTVKLFFMDDLLVIKVSIPRKAPQGARYERDMHAGQQYIPLLDFEL